MQVVTAPLAVSVATSVGEAGRDKAARNTKAVYSSKTHPANVASDKANFGTGDAFRAGLAWNSRRPSESPNAKQRYREMHDRA